MTQTVKSDRREEWRKKLAEFRASGLSGAAWCAAQGIKPHLFYYWLKRLAPEQNEADNAKTQWLALSVSDNHSKCFNKDAGLCVRVGGAVVEVSPGFNSQLLADVIKVLTGLC